MELEATPDLAADTDRLTQIARQCGKFAAFGLLLCGLYLISLHNYLIFHSLAEVFSLVVGCGVFVIVWNSRRRLDNSFFLLLGIALLCAGGLDLIHTLAYKGMGVFADRDANFPTQLWIAARYLTGLVFLLATAFVHARCRALPVFAACAAATLLLLAAVWTGLFPDCYVEGAGLTQFKIASEYVISLLFVAATANLIRQRSAFDVDTLRALVLCLGLSIAAELSFTAYASVFGFANMAGHLLRLAASYVLYVSIVRIGLQRPHDVLFRQLRKSELALRESEKHIRQLSDAAAEGIAFHEQGIILDANEAFARLCGLHTGAELVGRHCLALLPLTPESREQLGAGMLAQDDAAGEIVCVWPDGARRVFEIAGRSAAYRGRDTRMLSVRDITERKCTETLLRARLRLSNLGHAGRIDELGQAALDAAEEVTGSQIGFLHLVDADQEHLTLQAWSTNTLARMCNAEGKGQHYAISAAGVWVDCVRERAPVIHNDYAGLAHKKGLPEGHARVTRELVVPVMREGRVTQIMGVGNKATDYVQADVDAVQMIATMVDDIAERWRAASALRDSENNYQTLADFSPSLIWASGTDRVFNYVNQPWLSFTGRSLEQELGNGWAAGVHPEDFQRLLATYTDAFDRRVPFSLEWRLRRHDGEFRWLRNDGGARHDRNGVFIGYLGYCVDITESKAFEQALIVARAAAESANRVKSKFLTNMSHEFRTPLNGVLGNAQLLQMSDLGAGDQAYLSAIVTSGNNLLSLTNDILDMSKIETASIVLERGEFSLRECVDQVMHAHRPRGAGKGPSLKVQMTYEVPDALLGDPSRLKQILNKLLGNAIKFTDKGSITLTASLKQRDGDNAIIEICVIDTGIGIGEAVAREIFNPFVQADDSTSRCYGGSGLGLTIAQRLAELMGGSISVQSTEGVGSAFRVLLPFTVIHWVVQEPDAPGVGEQTATGSGTPLKVLLAEDNAICWQFGIALLKKLGHQVTLAENGKDALAALAREAFDIVLMDIQMPVMDGVQALAVLRKRERGANTRVPVIALTACALQDDEKQFLDEGFDGYVSKPLEVKKLVAEMRRVLDLKYPAEIGTA